MDLKEKLVSSFMAFEDRYDVQHYMMYKAAIKKLLKIKVSQPKRRSLGNTPVKY
jgi:hypothetical protein